MQPASPSTGNYSEEQVLERIELAPGVYLVRYRHWTQISLIETNADIPDPIIAPEPRRKKLPIPDWHLNALCNGMDDEIFFGAEDQRVRPSLSRTGLALAQSVCEQCPVRFDCLTHALTKPEGYGVWGGTSGRMREEMLFRVMTGESIATVIDEYLEND
jgi:WhiB family redox-sensing transcriptional regulator